MVLINLFAGWEWRCRHREQIYRHSGERGGETNEEYSIDIYTLPCVKQTAGGKLLHSTGSSAQCTVMMGVGRAGEFRREGIHVYNGRFALQYSRT